MHVLEHSCVHGMPVSKRWRCHSGSCGPASASGATLRVGLGDQPFSGSTFSLSTLVSTWAVPAQADSPGLCFTAPASGFSPRTSIDAGALSCNLRSGSDAAPGRERELARKSLYGGGSPSGLSRSAQASFGKSSLFLPPPPSQMNPRYRYGLTQTVS